MIINEKTDIINGLYLEKHKEGVPFSTEEYYTSVYYDKELNIIPYDIKTEKDEVIGYIYIEKREDNMIYIQMIEILDSFKGMNYGTKVVNNLFDWFNVIYLEGSVLRDSGLSAYYFWLSLGADIDAEMNQYDEPNFDCDVTFILKKEGVL